MPTSWRNGRKSEGKIMRLDEIVRGNESFLNSAINSWVWGGGTEILEDLLIALEGGNFDKPSKKFVRILSGETPEDRKVLWRNTVIDLREKIISARDILSKHGKLKSITLYRHDTNSGGSFLKSYSLKPSGVKSYLGAGKTPFFVTAADRKYARTAEIGSVQMPVDKVILFYKQSDQFIPEEKEVIVFEGKQ
jgi:hypothetical protein